MPTTSNNFGASYKLAHMFLMTQILFKKKLQPETLERFEKKQKNFWEIWEFWKKNVKSQNIDAGIKIGVFEVPKHVGRVIFKFRTVFSEKMGF